MALRKRSLFLYGLEVTENNRSLDFKISGGGGVLQASLTLGYYSLSELATEIERAMFAVDPTNTYTVTIDRSINLGEENRVTIETDGAYLDLLFSSGPRVASSCASLIGFPAVDQTGAVTYTGTTSAGTPLISDLVGYNYSNEKFNRKIFGSVNVSTSGLKESIVWQVQKFLVVTFKHEPEAKVLTEWSDFFTWAIQQRPFEFTPEIDSYDTVYDVTLESTTADGKGLAFEMKEELPNFPFLYDTGPIKMRVRES